MNVICGRRGWTEADQDWSNPCVCILPPGHDGLHECGEWCGGTWAGGVSADQYQATPNRRTGES